MDAPIITVILRALAVGAIAGLLLWLAGLAPGQALIVGAWVMMAAAFAQHLSRQPRRGLALFGYGTILLFNLLAFVLPSFDYGVDRPLLWLVLLLPLGILLVEQYRPRHRRAPLLYAALAAATLGYGARFVSPCSLGPCRPAPWAEQLAFSERALAGLGDGWVIEGVSAWPARENIFWFAEQPNLEVLVLVGRTVPAGGELPYPTSSFSYNDLDPARTLDRSSSEGRSSGPPNAADMAALLATRVGPREALNATRGEAGPFLGRAARPYNARVELETDGEDARPAWRVTYIDPERGRQLRIWVSALDGSVLRREESAR